MDWLQDVIDALNLWPAIEAAWNTLWDLIQSI